MRWLKIVFILLMILGGLYAVSMFFVEENRKFVVEKEINYPVDKVFPQFSSLRNFASWNEYFRSNSLTFQYFLPYEGQGSAMTYADRKNRDNFGEVFIRYENPNKTLKYQMFEGHKNTPYLIDLKFVPLGEKTKIIWYIQTPKQPFLKRSLNLISEDSWVSNIDQSVKNLYQLLGNKVDREMLRENITFDSLMVEKQESQLLLGVNVTTKNVKDGLFKNTVLNHNKVLNYVRMDLGKKEDEFGEPVLITDADNYKDKEVSYFYGVPLSRKTAVSDNNFAFRTVNSSDSYVIFYRGPYSGRVRAIQQLLAKAKKDSMRTGDLQQTFVEDPEREDQTVLKLSLPVFR